MKPKVLFLIITIFVAGFSIGQNVTKADLAKFKIKSITTIDSDGKTKCTEFYDDQGNFIKRIADDQRKELELVYDDSSRLVEERVYTSNGDINRMRKYFYNSKSQLIKKESISSGEVDATWTYQYDDNGNKDSETQTSGTMGNSFTKYQYGSNHLLIQEDKINNTIGKEERVNYKYNEKGQVIEKKTKYYYFNTTIILTHFYDEAGRLIKLNKKSSNGVFLTTIFEYDENGLPISDTWEDSLSKTAYKTRYQINYE